ncbi:MAG: hypothetical protein K0R43_602 [Pseudoduganella sp.]|jgi:hypothetical protein|nr:hypothetical protein [Pseudoduganella sp.]
MRATAPYAKLTAMPYALMLPLLPLAMLVPLAFIPALPAYRIPEQFPFWIFFFGLPHIVSSFQTMCDAEYLAAYRRETAVILALLVLPLALVTAGVPAALLLTVVLILTQHHVVAQQYGMALAVARMRPGAALFVCKWSTMTLGILATLLTYSASDIAGTAQSAILQALADTLAAPLLAVVAASGALLVWRARHHLAGAAIFAMNVLLFAAALILILRTQYALLGLMLVRILHDLSGFVVYISHDSARNRTQRKNMLYRLVPLLPVWLLNLAFALVLAAGMTWLANRLAWVAWLVTGLTIAHYYMESRIWRGPTPHRQHLRFAA